MRGALPGGEDMRLVCPNCDAQYEVGSDAIPKAGRDVQCSSCGQTWFQAHPDFQPPAPEPEPEPAPAPQPAPAPAPPPPAPEPEETAPFVEEGLDDLEDLPAPETAREMPERRALDEGVEAVLREEAERERRAREEERGGLERQPDLGLEEGIVSTVAVKAARERAAKMRGAEPAEAEEPTSRKDLLPDIDSINSTLRSQSERTGEEEPVETPDKAAKRAKRKRGFRMGFGLALVIAACGYFAYDYAPMISDRVPEASPYLSAYINWVDQMRALLDQTVRDGTQWLQSLVEKVSNGGE